MIENNRVVEYEGLEHQHFNLLSLYERLMATKRCVFMEEKANASAFSFNQERVKNPKKLHRFSQQKIRGLLYKKKGVYST
jgi:hypothetical protein